MKKSSMEFGSTWVEYLNIRTPMLWITNFENDRILRSLKIGSVWDKYGEKVITRTIFFCTIIRGSKYFSAVLPHTSPLHSMLSMGKQNNCMILVMILCSCIFELNYNA